MVNRSQPHVLVLPEDSANRQLAIGFALKLDWSVRRRIQVLPEANGWIKVLDCFESDYTSYLDRWPDGHMVPLIDFDGNRDRATDANKRIPERLAKRAFILGALNDPEGLKSAGVGSYEKIGTALAEDCREETNKTWQHDLLKHNTGELHRLREYVGQFCSEPNASPAGSYTPRCPSRPSSPHQASAKTRGRETNQRSGIARCHTAYRCGRSNHRSCGCRPA